MESCGKDFLKTPEDIRERDRQRYRENPLRKEQLTKSRNKWLAVEGNREKECAARRDRYKANPDYYLETTRKQRVQNPKRSIFASLKSKAKTRNLEFTLDIDDIIIPERCPVFNVPLIYNIGKGQSPYSISIDRIDNTKGYVKGNIQVVSKKANAMKQDATQEELLQFARWVLNESNYGNSRRSE